MLVWVTSDRYLGAWLDSSVRDIKIRRAKAWSACHKMKTIWNSTMSKAMKVRLFIATVESVYGHDVDRLDKLEPLALLT